MSLVVQMDGLPANADANAVVLAVRKILQKLKIKFWVHDFGYSPETNTKKCKIEFFAKHEATKAISKITSVPQTIVGVPCNLKITYINEKNKADKKTNQESRRDRSRSPITKEEANINKELEQLKKEKEELEKRKSELLKKKMNIDQKETKGDDTAKDMVAQPKIQHTILPKCTAAEISIIEQMKPLLKPHVQQRYYQIFMQRMHVEIRMRLAILLETSKLQKTSRTEDIVKAYRWRHPHKSDPETINNIKSQIKMAFWAYWAKNKDGTNTEPYEYDESEEDDDTVAEKEDDVNNEVEMAAEENADEITENDEPTAITENDEPTGITENDEPTAITENDEPTATEAAEDSKEESDIAFEDGTDWNEEGNKVEEVAA